MKTASYISIRDKLQTFDLVLWWGKASLSRFIRFATGGPSHVCMVLRDYANDLVLLWEATTKEDKSGVMLSPMSLSVEEYDGEFGWRAVAMPDDLRKTAELRLPEVRKQLEGRPFEKNWLEFIKAGYDGPGGQNTRDISTLFCSETVAETWQQCGLLFGDKVSNEYTPRDFDADAKHPLEVADGVTIGPKVMIEGGKTFKGVAKSVVKVNTRGLVKP